MEDKLYYITFVKGLCGMHPFYIIHEKDFTTYFNNIILLNVYNNEKSTGELFIKFKKKNHLIDNHIDWIAGHVHPDFALIQNTLLHYAGITSYNNYAFNKNMEFLAYLKNNKTITNNKFKSLRKI